MSMGKSIWREARETLTKILSKNEGILRDNIELREKSFIHQSQAEMFMPANIGDYTDFYASKDHASNVGTMFRGKENALMPNWLHIPIGYHGRSSSIVISGTPVRRPRGQLKPNETDPPIFAPCKILDYEIELAWFIGTGNELGEPIQMNKIQDHLFGAVIMNDWSARDIQKWEYVPLGPFTAKNWATTISPWVVTFDALEPFLTYGTTQDPTPLPYLTDKGPSMYDIQLSAYIKTEKSTKPQLLTDTNAKYLYWSIKQQTVHHTVSGCNLRPGDLLASGTISGTEKSSWGSLLEISWQGRDEITITETGEKRKFIADGDTIIFEGFCQGQGYRVGFGFCEGKVLPAHTWQP